MRPVEIGSRAEAGSSRSSTSVDGDSARNAQPAAAGRPRGWCPLLQLVLDLFPKRRLSQSPFDALLHLAHERLSYKRTPKAMLRGWTWETASASGTPCRLWRATCSGPGGAKGCLPVDKDLASRLLLGVERVHAVEGCESNVDFAAARGTDERGNSPLRNLEIDVFQSVKRP